MTERDTPPPGVLSDRWIRKLALEQRMIEPFVDHQVRDGVISYGLSSYGYDVRVADEFRIMPAGADPCADPKRRDPDSDVEHRTDVLTIPPHAYVLGRTVEYLRIPRDVITICFGKSTYARCGVIVNVTPFEPEWEGYATLSIVNTGPQPARLYAGEGIAQVLFLVAGSPCAHSYADRRGKYQAQRAVTPPRL
ncbi:MAG: dCTP deaminase [Candidatus Eiseniibacteriota bacterium]|jgi:dCTP deaminase